MPGLAIPIVLGRGIEGLGRVIEGDIDFEGVPRPGGGEVAGPCAAAPLLWEVAVEYADGCPGAGEADGAFGAG